jgi:hypothetical protein
VTAQDPFSYKASYQYSAFSTETIPMHGSVRNIEDQTIKSNFTLNFEVPYSKCTVSGWVEVTDGYF